MKTKLIITLFIAAIFTANAQDRTVKELVEKYYPKGRLFVGMANHQTVLNQMQGEIADREFNYQTPANDFKQTVIHPTFKVWNFDRADAWVKHAKEKNQILRIHGPISPQCSKWVKEDNRTPEELSKMLDEYMIALCSRYGNNPSIKWLDVINEIIAVEDKEDKLANVVKGEWFGPRFGTDKWENPWPAIGYDESTPLRVPLYIDRAFEIAEKYAPKWKYVINEHGQFEPEVWEKMKKLVYYLRNDKHRRVDAIGWQAHIELGWEKKPGNLEHLSAFIDWCHQNKLEFHITEMNVWLKEGNEGKFKEQADTYGTIFDLLFSKTKTGVIGLNFWNVMDKDVPFPQYTGTLWNDKGEARPGFTRLKESLIKNAIINQKK